MERMLRFGFVAILGLFAVATARADDGALDKLYGEGVHAYFAGNSDAAHRHLTEAIEAGSRDPRAYYFRGLASLRLGFRDAAGDDFHIAATLETRNADAPSVVSQSLQRIQGSLRTSIEKHRVDARLAALQEQRSRDATRYGESRTRARQELETRAGTAKAAPPATPTTSADVAPPAGSPANEELFGDVTPAEATEEMPAEETTPAEGTPAEEAAPAEEAMPGEETTPGEEATPGEETTPMEEAPMEEAPMEEAPAVDPAAEAVPADGAHAEGAPAEEKQASTKKSSMSLDKLGGIIGRSVGSLGGGLGKSLEKAAAGIAPVIPRGAINPSLPGGGGPGEAGTPVLPAGDGGAADKPNPFEDETIEAPAGDGAAGEGEMEEPAESAATEDPAG